MSNFNPDDWERHKNYHYRHKETGRIMHEETFFAQKRKYEMDVLSHETIESILEEAVEAAEYAKEQGRWGEHDGIMSLVDELRSEMYD